jgi:saccharopine dehydrogenase-like NADP-dependent oxidoreductase
MKAVVFGGFGVFGSQVARDLQGAGIDVVICGRRLHGQPIPVAGRFVRADVHDRASCESAIAGAAVAVNCAGPLNPDNLALIEACLAEGVHYTDIADDRGYCARVRAAGPRFAERRLTVGWGLSSLPGISGALAAALHDGVSPRLARVTLFIGNRNPKGHPAVASALRMVGAPIAAPQATLVGFRDFVTVETPPFGPRRVRCRVHRLFRPT